MKALSTKEEEMEKTKAKEKGITLIALVITIIIKKLMTHQVLQQLILMKIWE